MNKAIKVSPFYDQLVSKKDANSIYLKYYSGSRLKSSYKGKDFYRYTIKLAKYLATAYKVGYGSKVVVKFHNSDCCLLSYAALMLLGVTIVPIDPDITEEKEQYILKHSKAVLILADKTSSKNNTLCIDEELLNTLTFSLEKDLQRCDSDFESLLIYTSGTTGEPKGVLLSFSALINNASSVIAHHNMNKRDIHMCVLPLHHTNAFNFSFLATFIVGSRLILNRNFSLLGFWSIASNENVTVISVVPKIIKLLNHDRRDSLTKIDSIKYFVSAAAPLSTEDATFFYNRYGYKVLQGYGMSEAVNFSLTMPTTITNKTYETLLKDTIFSAGIELPSNKVYILDSNLQPLQEQEEGEFYIKSNSLMSCYYKNKFATKQTIVSGMIRTGDVGFFKQKGNYKYFYITGRSKEIIIKNGKKIAPSQLENSISEKIKGLNNYAVVGFKNNYVGEEVGLYVYVDGDIPDKKIVLEKLKNILGAEAPVVIVFGDEVVPTTKTGKIQRLKLVKYFDSFKETYFK